MGCVALDRLQLRVKLNVKYNRSASAEVYCSRLRSAARGATWRGRIHKSAVCLMAFDNIRGENRTFAFTIEVEVSDWGNQDGERVSEMLYDGVTELAHKVALENGVTEIRVKYPDETRTFS